MCSNDVNQPLPASAAPASRDGGHTSARRDVVVIGASAGGVQALTAVMERLPADFPAAVFVVLHVMASGHSMLAPILSRSGPLPASVARDGEPVVPARVYVAPPDTHMLLADDVVRLSGEPPQKGARPAVDVLFRSAAHSCGPRVIGVILSGLLDDGAAGLRLIKEHGGVAVVQEPVDAQFDAMPRRAIEAVAVDRLAPAREIPGVLVELVAEAGQRGSVADLRRAT